MLYSGVYTKGDSYLFRIVTSGMRNELLVCTRDEKDYTADLRYQSATLTGKLSSDTKQRIIAHAILNKSLEIKSYSGSYVLIEQILKICSESSLWKTVVTDTIELPKHINSNMMLYVKNENYNVVRVFPHLEYKTIKKSDNLNITTRFGSVRSMEELSKLYDLTWAIDENYDIKLDYKCITEEEELQELVEDIKSHKVISFDLEATDTDFFYRDGENDVPHSEREHRIVGIGICCRSGHPRYIPLESYKFETLDAQHCIETILPLLEKKWLIGANLAYDIRVCYSYGYVMKKVKFDTMQAEFVLDPTGSRGHKSLKEMTRYYLNEETLELDEVLGGAVDGRLIPYLDKNVITLYGCSDTDTVMRLVDVMSKYMVGLETVMKIDMKMIPIIAIEDYYGLKIDAELLTILDEVNRKDQEKVEKTLYTYLSDVACWNLTRDLLKKSTGNSDISDELIQYTLDENPEIKDLSKDSIYKTNKKGEKNKLNLSSSKDLSYIFHELLRYPEIRSKTGTLSHDDVYLERLILQNSKEPNKFLQEDIRSSLDEYSLDWVKPDNKELVLVSKKKFDNCKYPFCILLKEWRKLNKRQTSFLNVLNEKGCKSWYNTSTSMTAADTARFINPAQTLQGYMKRLIRSYDDDHYFVDFDLAQIEFRVMIGMAVQYWESYKKTLPDGEVFDEIKKKDISYLIDKLNIEWADYHREGGAPLVNTTPAKMTKSQRSAVKGPHFAIPYGGEAMTIAKDRLLGVTDENTKSEILEEVEQILSAWRYKMYPLYAFLQTKRSIAKRVITDANKLPPRLRERGEWGIVTNSLGRRRYYNLDYYSIAHKRAKQSKIDLTKMEELDGKEYNSFIQSVQRSVEGSIERSAGNYPIQSLAREFFAMMMIKLFEYTTSNGLSGTGKFETDTIIQSLMIHDENHLQIRKTLHPFEVYKILMNHCILDLKGFPKMYIGISICDNWYECKDDVFEAPVEFVKDMIAMYEEDPDYYNNEDWKSSPKNYIQRYLKKWIHEYTSKFIDENTVDNVFDLVKFREHNENYFVFTKVGLYTNKFNNSEDDIQKTELIILSHNENNNLIVRTDKRDIPMSDYVWDYVKEEVKPDGVAQKTDLFSDIFDEDFTKSDSNLDGIDDLSFDDISFDMDDLGIENDSLIKELDAEECYWLYSEAERTYNTEAELEVETVKETSDREEIKPVFSKMMLLNGLWIVDIRKMKESTMKELANYLRQFKHDNGYQVIWKAEDGEKRSNIKLSGNVDMDTVELIYNTAK